MKIALDGVSKKVSAKVCVPKTLGAFLNPTIHIGRAIVKEKGVTFNLLKVILQ